MGSAAEVVFFPLKPSSDPHAVFARAKASWNKHPGFRAAYYGVMIEDPKISCLVMDWQDKNALIKWTGAYNPDEVEDGKMALINMEAGLDPFATFINFKHDPTAALSAPVTEFGFFSLPDKLATEKNVMEKLVGDSDITQHPVMTVGKAKGAATGHVFAVKPEMAKDNMTTAFAGVFGYDSVEDHWKWRDTPEHAEVIKGMDVMVKELGLQPVDVLGKRRAMIEGSGILHVKFEKVA